MRSNRAGVCFGAPISEAEAITSAAHSVLCWQQGQKGSHALPGGKYKIDFDRMRQVRVGNESKRRHVRRKAPAEGVPPQRARAGPSFPAHGAAFVPAATFAGARPGYVFKTGPQGLGYYKG